MRTPEQAETFLKGTKVFESRFPIWRAILEYNPNIHGNRDIDNLTDKEITTLIAANHPHVKVPCDLRWKYPARDREMRINAEERLIGIHGQKASALFASMRLQKRIRAGGFKEVAVARHYFVIHGMYLEEPKPEEVEG